ncbi:MAG: hypothetical protein QNJ20_11560 [Paracoccaceae bacterium]|nr:hypothetical protein [Paracoccaceae bacterium]
MEALLIIFAEIIFACLAPFFALIGAAIGAIFEFIVLLLAMIFGGVGSGVSKPKPGKQKRRKPLVPRKVLHWSAGIVGGLGVLGVLATFVFFDPIVRSVLTRAAEKANITLAYEDSEGSLLAGRVALAGLDMSRASEDGLAFNLKADRIEADVDLWSLFGTPRIEFAHVDGLSGTITPPDPKDQQIQANPSEPKARRPFQADQVLVENIALQVAPRGREAYALDIDRGEVAPFRSQTALFDLLFRSNLSAKIAGQPLTVKTRQISANGRETIWDFDQVEVDQLKLILPKAPLTWLSDGTVTVRVEDRWDLDDEEIDMDWRIALDGINVATPDNAGTAERLMAGGLARAVEAKGGNADFRYQLDLDQEEVAALRAGDLDAFWDVVLSGFVDERLARLGIGTGDDDGDAEGGGRLQRTFDALRNRLGGDEVGE